MKWFNLTREEEKYFTSRIKICNEKISKDFHTQSTPFSLCVEMVDKLGSEVSKEKNWLIVANLEFVVVLKEYFKYKNWDFGRVSFATPCPVKERFAKVLGVKNVYLYTDIKNWKPDMKFDRIVMNPPYKQGLHMKFLDKSFDLLSGDGELICVHDITEKIKNSIVSLNMKNPNTIFRTAFFVPLCITHLKRDLINSGKILVDFQDPSVKEFLFDNINDVNIRGGKEEVFSLKNKMSILDSILSYQLTKNNYRDFEFVIELGVIRGHRTSDLSKMVADDFYTIVPKQYKIKSYLESKWKGGVWGFDTQKEAENFLNYLKTNFARRLFSLLKFNQHVLSGELKLVPWLDFTQEWTDEKLFKHFDLSEAEINFVNDLPSYY